MKPKEARADALWSKLIKVMYPRCIFGPSGCGYFAQRQGDEAHHIVPRRFHAVRWHYCNGIRLCPHHHDWVHAYPEAAQVLINKKVPAGVLRLLEGIDYHKAHIVSASVLEQQITQLKHQLEHVESVSQA